MALVSLLIIYLPLSQVHQFVPNQALLNNLGIPVWPQDGGVAQAQAQLDAAPELVPIQPENEPEMVQPNQVAHQKEVLPPVEEVLQA